MKRKWKPSRVACKTRPREESFVWKRFVNFFGGNSTQAC